MASWEAFELTTVHQPLGQMAKAAARMLVSRMEADHPVAARREAFAARVVVRGTTDVPRS